MLNQNVVLIGPPGSGKTSVGQILAVKTAKRFFDTDHVIEQRHGMRVSDIFASHGEAFFRRLESELLEEMAGKRKLWSNVVIGTGGGIIVAPENLPKLKRIGTVVCLIAPVKCLLERLKSDDSRPLLNAQDEGSKEKRLVELLSARERKYRNARYTIETGDLAPEDVAIAIEKLLCMSDNTSKEAASGIECADG